jgi:hypothetical protein
MVRRALADSEAARLPLAVVLGGHYTGREAARMLGETRGVIVAALSYPYEGSPRPDVLTFLRDIPRIRGAFLDTPPAVMLALDYLLRDPTWTPRVEAIGVKPERLSSALRAPIRVTRAGHCTAPVVLTPLKANISGLSVLPLRASGRQQHDGREARLVRWVPNLRPFVMVNASGDERLPRAAIDALYAAAREPKELVWMPGLHVHADRETIEQLVSIVMGRVRDGPAR